MIDPRNGSVVKDMPNNGAIPGDAIVLWLASAADEIPVWGSNMKYRDAKLREFYKREPFLASSIYSVAARRASYRFTLKGPERQRHIIHRILHNSEHGRGWLALMVPFVKDVLTQDNGAFMEMIHTERDNPASPVVQLNHLDSARCMRTGNWDTPVIYTDLFGGAHELKWWQVIHYTEFPDPDERFRGYQQCSVSRLLLKAQTVRDTEIHDQERASGRDPSTLHLVVGIPQERLDNLVKLAQNKADNQGLTHYMGSPIIAGYDPTARLAYERIDLKSVPEGYKPDEYLRWYTLLIALAIGVDPQEIAPLPGGNLGSAQQSTVLRDTGRGKGNALFMQGMEHIMNFHGIIPQTIEFKYQEQDIAENEQLTMLRWRRMQMHRLASGNGTQEPILPANIIRQMMRDDGDLQEEYLEALGEQDLTPTTTQSSSDKKSWKSWFRR